VWGFLGRYCIKHLIGKIVLSKQYRLVFIIDKLEKINLVLYLGMKNVDI